LIVIIIQLLFSINDAIFQIFFQDITRNTPVIWITKAILYMVPTFSIAVVYGTIVRIASTHPDSNYFGWVKGRDYTWDDFF
jgi:hypothetical protein